jgi:hypothetical protein
MNIRIIVLCLAFASSLGHAQEPPKLDEKSERAAMLKTMLKGKFLIGDNEESYQHLPEMRAVLSTSLAETPQQVVTQLGVSGAQVVETKGKYVLFRKPLVQPALLQGFGDSTDYAVVLNTRTKNFGVLTGVQVVVPRDMADATAIANDFGMDIVREFSHLRTVFYRVSPGIDIADLTAELQADPRIEKAHPEIIEYLHEPL